MTGAAAALKTDIRKRPLTLPYRRYSSNGRVNSFNLAKNEGASGGQIERFLGA